MLKFKLIKYKPIVVYRKELGTIVRGRPVEGAEIQVTIQMNVQPLKPSEIMLLPEAERTREWQKAFSEQPLRTLQEGTGGWDADEFEWLGYRYRVMKLNTWDMDILDHFEAFVAKIPVTPN